MDVVHFEHDKWYTSNTTCWWWWGGSPSHQKLHLRHRQGEHFKCDLVHFKRVKPFIRKYIATENFIFALVSGGTFQPRPGTVGKPLITCTKTRAQKKSFPPFNTQAHCRRVLLGDEVAPPPQIHLRLCICWYMSDTIWNISNTTWCL